MINDKAYVPSDVLTASNGLTIEIMNTDVRSFSAYGVIFGIETSVMLTHQVLIATIRPKDD